MSSLRDILAPDQVTKLYELKTKLRKYVPEPTIKRNTYRGSGDNKLLQSSVTFVELLEGEKKGEVIKL
jgi:hypothetical protein